MLTKAERDRVARFKQNSPGAHGTDEEILAKLRFVEEGNGIKVYDSVEAFNDAAGVDDIQEI